MQLPSQVAYVLLCYSFMSLSRCFRTNANGARPEASRRFAAAPWTLSSAIVLSFAAEGCSSTGAGPTRTDVPLAVVSGPRSVVACASGYAHPNVCCQAGPTEATVCTEVPSDPFSACDPHLALTFPDPRNCCPLDGEGSCLDVATDAATPTTPVSCESSCVVGQFPPPPSWPIQNCADDSSPGCSLCCNSAGCAAIGVCSCTASSPEGSTPTVCGCESTPSCGTCPGGWQTRSGIPELCCRTTAANQCFSQSIYIP